MSQIDKIKVGSTTYDVAQSSSATFTGTSSDSTTATAWTDVDVLASGETNASIFTKISKMFKNIRFLYNQLGTSDYSATGASTVSGALANLQTNKAASTHSHTVADLPVTNQQNNSDDTIPTSSLIYSMNTTLTSLNDAFKFTANSRFEYKSLGAWSSVSSVTAFLNEYTHSNDYKGTSGTPLSCGNYVTINDGTYNVDWIIAGFDTEYMNGDTASGYGITMIPRTYVTTGYMNSTHTTTGGYYNSYMCKTLLPSIATKLQNVLGSHLQSRRVLLTNSIDTNATSGGYSGWTGCSNNWSWYSEYLTLMSEVQVYGSRVFGNGFDVGEAKEKLPLFNFINPNNERVNFWLRAVANSSDFAASSGYGNASYDGAAYSYCVRPLIYLA